MKKLLTILVLIMLIVSFFQIANMYALYKEQLQSDYSSLLGVWAIKVNGIDISSGEENLTFTMTEDKNNNTEKTSRKRPPKDRHIDVRFTEDEFNHVLKNAQLSGRSKSIYLHDIALGHKPSLPMTTEQQEALKGLTGARAELVYIRNALHALPQAERKKLFKRADFMERWLQGVNDIIREWSNIRNRFIEMI